MGLDNGILKKSKKDPSVNEEICYWRKCHGIRKSILKVLNPMNKQDVYSFNIDREDIPAIIRALRPFFSKEYWEDNADSIWEFDEMFDNLIDQVISLKTIYKEMENDPDIILSFYDSY